MSIEQTKSMPTKRWTVASLITSPSGLGYCCLWAFFYTFRRTSVIARRLGIATRTVKQYRSAWADGAYECQNCPNCMRHALKIPPRFEVKQPRQPASE